MGQTCLTPFDQPQTDQAAEEYVYAKKLSEVDSTVNMLRSILSRQKLVWLHAPLVVQSLGLPSKTSWVDKPLSRIPL